jgi:uncharacterized membrane protein
MQEKEKWAWSLVITSILIMIIWIYIRTLNSITVFSKVSLREYEIDTTNVDEYSAAFRISPAIW